MIRRHIGLDGRWEFFPDPAQRLTIASLGVDEAGREIRVPGPWQAQFDDLRDYSGVAWYRLRFGPVERGPGAWLLRFGAVDYFAAVYLNGRPVGEHEGGYLPFELDVTGALRADGQNEVVVRVIDPGNDADFLPDFTFAEIPHGKQSWYGSIGGIWQSVSLERRPEFHLCAVRMTPDVAGEQAHARISLNREPDRGTGVRFRVSDPSGAVKEHRFELASGAIMEEFALPVPAPVLWDTVAPNLYRVEAALVPGGNEGAEPLDSLTTTFGMRGIATNATGHLLLNGRVLYLRGALDQDYYPDLICTPTASARVGMSGSGNTRATPNLHQCRRQLRERRRQIRVSGVTAPCAQYASFEASWHHEPSSAVSPSARGWPISSIPSAGRSAGAGRGSAFPAGSVPRFEAYAPARATVPGSATSRDSRPRACPDAWPADPPSPRPWWRSPGGCWPSTGSPGAAPWPPRRGRSRPASWLEGWDPRPARR
ncbi:MAG TPA: hypothetical protein VMN37_00965 [Gemmatimonadales bacterium]|nr:hypothetical protein [Gemmatimonadales bacterium]